MRHSFEQQLVNHWSPHDWSDVTVLVAVSGGADSLALLRAMLAVKEDHPGRLIAVHFNHRLRGTESDDDAAFVRDQCSQLGVSCEIGAVGDQGIAATEDAARQVRYDFFRQTARKTGARYVATAHNADDQAETILHRILRGTGLDGLAGIPRTRELVPGVSLVRPILWCTRNETREYLRTIGQPFREDSSNNETRYTRNRLRHELIPLLEREYNPRVKEALFRLGELAYETQSTISKLVQGIQQTAVSHGKEDGVNIRCEAFYSIDPHVVRQTLIQVWRDCGWPMQEMTSEHWRKLQDLTTTTPTHSIRASFPSGVRAERDGLLLRLTRSIGTIHELPK